MILTEEEILVAIKAANRMNKNVGSQWVNIDQPNWGDYEHCSIDEKRRYG